MEADGVPVVDVDGSFLYKKYNKLSKQVILPPIPPPPVSGWTVMTGENYQSLASSIPRVSQGRHLSCLRILLVTSFFYSYYRFSLHILSCACWSYW